MSHVSKSNTSKKLIDRISNTTTIKEYVNIFEEKKLKELEIESVDTKIIFRKNVILSNQNPVASSPIKTVEVETVNNSAELTISSSVTDNNAEEKKSSYKEIVSPITGTFYEAASPNSNSYIKIGDSVDKTTIVCIVEAMKVMNEIKAGVSGKIVDILVKNQETVEADQPLFLIE